MRVESIQAFFKLIRLNYSLFAAFGVLISGILAGDLHDFQLEFLVAFFIVFFFACGNYAFNDYYDFEADKRNERYDRPLVLGLLSKRIALMTSFVSFYLVFMLSLFLDLLIITLILAILLLFLLYSLYLKKVLVIKNILAAFAFVATILFGSLISDTIIEPLIVYFAAMGLIVGVALEIMFDIGDVRGDKELGLDTLPIRFGLKTAAQISVILYGVIMILDPLPFFLQIDLRLYRDYLFLILILIPVASYFFISKSLIEDQSPKNIVQLKRRIVGTMQVGTLAYLIGVLF